jgi:RecA/RadA recombinase
MCLIIISQIRDKIGVMFGEKHSRSGGKALDFYASLIVWLTELKKIQKTIKGVKRSIGISVKAKEKKNQTIITQAGKFQKALKNLQKP